MCTRAWPLLVLLSAAALAGALGLASGASDFASVDAHALAAPDRVERSVSSLAAYLIEPARNDREKARAIYRWIAAHIDYDLGRSNEPTDAQAVLATRRSVCAGYAKLFAALAKEAGLEAVVVRGHSKGVSYQVGRPEPLSSNHSWNAVKVDGRWQLVDCTWGAGTLQGRGFVRHFENHYFLTPPDAFADDHFPNEPKWQLLSHPLSASEYLSRVQRRPAFFAGGLRLISCRTTGIQAEDSLLLEIGAPRETALIATLEQRGRILDGYVFAQREGDRYVIRAAFPRKGEYVLRIFSGAKGKAQQGLDLALEHAVTAKKAWTIGGFPEALGDFVKRDCQLEKPFAQRLPAGKQVEFALIAPGAEDVIVGTGKQAKSLPSRGRGHFAGAVQVARGDVVVFARFPGEKSYAGLLRYTAR